MPCDRDVCPECAGTLAALDERLEHCQDRVVHVPLLGVRSPGVDLRETLESCLRQIDFLDTEIGAVDRLIAHAALESPEIRRLMTVPGVNVIVAATFLAAIGDIRRFRSPRKLVGYLGLDPRVRQSGTGPAIHGHISKQGSRPARHALVEACWSAVRQPGPLRAFYERVRARRGHQVAVVAAARKLASLFWCLLAGEEDYAFAQPSLTRKKLRRLEIAAGAPRYQGATGIWANNDAMRRAERELAEQAETGLRPHRPRLARHHGRESGRERDTGARITTAIEGQSRAADHKPLTSALRYVSHSRPP